MIDHNQLSIMATFTCDICMIDDLPADQQFTIEPCNHYICNDCSLSMVRHDLNRCPFCRQRISNFPEVPQEDRIPDPLEEDVSRARVPYVAPIRVSWGINSNTIIDISSLVNLTNNRLYLNTITDILSLANLTNINRLV